MTNLQPFLSVIIPVYNESTRLDGVITIADYLAQQPFSSELIVVDDGSTDDTLTRLQAIQTGCEFELVAYQPNHGKGYAIKRGMLAARGTYRLFTDVDLSTPIAELEKFLPLLPQFDVVIASRKWQDARIVKHQPRLRENLGRGFTFLSQVILQVPLSDFTCGFKCFSARAAEAIFSRLTIERWGFDSEAMFVAHQLGFAIQEVPVVWSNDPRTKVKLPDDIIRSLSELFAIRANGLQKKYKY